MSITVTKNDLPDDFQSAESIAIDTETMGLNPLRDRLCLVQLSNGDGTVQIVQFDGRDYSAPNLKALLQNQDILKIFHFARFDVAVLKHYLNVDCTPVYCTKIASKLVRTYTDRHGLKELTRELLDVQLDKQQQSSNWSAADLSQDQKLYAANDVLYLHRLKDRLDQMLKESNRAELAQSCFNFLPVRADLDLAGWNETDIFSHS
jgi:ribonuclease D